MRNHSESTPVIDEKHHLYKLLLISNLKVLAAKRSEAEVLQRRADSGTDLPPPRAQRSDIFSRKGDFKYEYKLYLLKISKYIWYPAPGGVLEDPPPPLVLGPIYIYFLKKGSDGGSGGVSAAFCALAVVYRPDMTTGNYDVVVELIVHKTLMDTLKSTLQACPRSAPVQRCKELRGDRL